MTTASISEGVVAAGDIRIGTGRSRRFEGSATGPARVPHRFTNVGDGVLRILGIHASPVITQTFLD
ncbi:MAG: hypothetical protein ACTIKQ_07850 [Microbacterium sp.]